MDGVLVLSNSMIANVGSSMLEYVRIFNTAGDDYITPELNSVTHGPPMPCV